MLGEDQESAYNCSLGSSQSSQTKADPLTLNNRALHSVYQAMNRRTLNEINITEKSPNKNWMHRSNTIRRLSQVWVFLSSPCTLLCLFPLRACSSISATYLIFLLPPLGANIPAQPEATPARRPDRPGVLWQPLPSLYPLLTTGHICQKTRKATTLSSVPFPSSWPYL